MSFEIKNIEGEGRGDPIAPPDSYVAIHYEASLPDGKVYDSSRDRWVPAMV